MAAMMTGLLVAPVSAAKMHSGNHRAEATLQKETKAQKDARMEWWREARLGMFIHWGLYSIPAGEYNGHTGYGEWIREEAHIPVNEYEKYRDEFNPVKFDADAWVKMAKDAGMKYITITTKHHDGFNLFDSPLTDWNIGHTPFKRDIMAEMAAACKKYGVKMCFYHSIMDWHHPDYLPRRSWEAKDRPADGADFDRFVKYLHDEVSWILTHYGPIGVVWFDGEWESTWSDKYGKPLYDLCRQLQPNVIVNNRVSVSRGGSMSSDGNDQEVGDFSTPEQTIPATGLPGVDWETCMTMNGHWGYNAHDASWKSSEVLIHNIVDIASKGGNYLLNVGPRSDGTFPPEAVDRLKAIGEFMNRSGEGIYDTQASSFETLPWGRSTTKRLGKTTKLYLHVFDWPKNGKLLVPGIGNKPLGAHVMGHEGMEVAKRSGGDIVVTVPKDMPYPYCTTVELWIDGAPTIYRAPKISAMADQLVTSVSATIAVPEGLAVHYTLDGSEPTASSPKYSSSIAISKSSTLRAASFTGTKRVSTVVEKKFEKVDPWPPQVVADGQQGLKLDEYSGTWDTLPDWSKLTPTRSTTTTTIDSLPNENFGRRYRGLIVAGVTDVYTFSLNSDDGSRLWIDGKLVVDNDGLHGAVTKMGSAPLAKGAHKIEIGWFNQTGGAALDLKWGRVGHALHTPTVQELVFERL